MRDTEFVAELLRLKSPWVVRESKIDLNRQRVDAYLEWEGPGLCPECNGPASKHDHRERTWRDLDLCGDQLFLHARVPRMSCPTHGIQTVPVPWAEGRTEFTSRFERLVIMLLRNYSVGMLRAKLAWQGPRSFAADSRR